MLDPRTHVDGTIGGAGSHDFSLVERAVTPWSDCSCSRHLLVCQSGQRNKRISAILENNTGNHEISSRPEDFCSDAATQWYTGHGRRRWKLKARSMEWKRLDCNLLALAHPWTMVDRGHAGNATEHRRRRRREYSIGDPRMLDGKRFGKWE
jgi:hypothetical protein